MKKDFLFVSDIHGRNAKMEVELSLIAQNKQSKPKIVVFTGDIVGTFLLDQLQKLFYNGVYNHIKKLLSTNPNPTNEEILWFPTENGLTLIDGAINLWNFLDNLDYSETDPPSMADYVRELVEYVHFGHFVSNLPKKICDILRQDMEKNAKIWADIMTQFTDQETLVVVNAGNWDARHPLDFYPTKECKPLPVEERAFYFKDFLKSLNEKILYFDKTDTIETENEIFVILPFDSAINLDLPKPIATDKKIVLISHAQVNWHAIKGDTPMTAEGQKIQENMEKIIAFLHPDYVIHGHLHDPVPDYLFNGIPVKYLPQGTCRFIDF
ncbi:MAG: hypothetical protein PHS06_04930 [Candidatus Shapirobacteria bacterium]|nr:hypothetical protein [Candidatus Shapirobacteria bacterium]